MEDLSKEKFAEYQRAKWAKLSTNWYDAGPPATPSKGDLAIYRKHLRCENFTDVLLLGCTPSIRSLCAEEIGWARVNLTIVDFNREMYISTTKQLHPTWREKFIELDWLRLGELLDLSFQLVLADKAVDNLHPDSWRTLFQGLAKIVQPGGRFIHHLGLQDDSLRYRDPAEALDHWVRRVKDHRVSYSEAAAGLWEDLLTSSAFVSPHAKILSVGCWKNELTEFEKASRAGHFSPEKSRLLDIFLHQFGDSIQDAWSNCSLEDLSRAAKGYFELEQVDFANDYEAARTQPIVELVRVA